MLGWHVSIGLSVKAEYMFNLTTNTEYPLLSARIVIKHALKYWMPVSQCSVFNPLSVVGLLFPHTVKKMK